MAIESINPSTGERLRSFAPLTPEAIHQKIALAHAAFADLNAVPLDHRALCMRKLASILDSESADIARLITTEMGKPIAAARDEVAKCAAACRYYAEHAARILTPESIPTDNARAFVRWDPLGVILAVMPWNFPLWQVFRFLAPALMAGNVGLLKHASNVPQCALLIESLVRRAGFPRGSFQALLIESRQVESVLNDEHIAAVTVTGSEAAGRAVAAQAGWLIKKSLLELGGSDPFLVMPSADLAAAVDAAVRARTVNSGQSCIAAKRFILHADVYNNFASHFVEAMQQLRPADPLHEDTQLGPLATARIAADLEKQVQTAVRDGATLLCGGSRIPGPGNFFQPTVLADVPRTSAVYREELFGPVAMLFRAQDLHHAITLANDTPYGLGASAWSRDPVEQQAFVSEINAGMVFLNSIVASNPALPFGGVKRSGYGRELSASGMREFLNAKTVVIA